MNNSNQNVITKSINTEEDTSSLLQAIGISFTDGGIIYFVEPLKKDCILRPLSDILMKDLILCSFHFRKGENQIKFKTNDFATRTYKDLIDHDVNNEQLQNNIYKPGEFIAEIYHEF